MLQVWQANNDKALSEKKCVAYVLRMCCGIGDPNAN